MLFILIFLLATSTLGAVVKDDESDNNINEDSVCFPKWQVCSVGNNMKLGECCAGLECRTLNRMSSDVAGGFCRPIKKRKWNRLQRRDLKNLQAMDKKEKELKAIKARMRSSSSRNYLRQIAGGFALALVLHH